MKIKKLEEELFEKVLLLEKYDEELNKLEMAEQIKILEAKNTEGKLLFSNDLKRKSELTLRLETNPLYEEITNIQSKLRREIFTLKTEIEFLKRQNNQPDELVKALREISETLRGGIIVNK